MNHREAQELLQAYADNELAAGEQAEIKNHLASCPECQAELQNLQKAGVFLKEALQPLGSYQIRRYLTPAEIRNKSLRKGIMPVLKPAGIIAVIALIVIIFRKALAPFAASVLAICANLLFILPEANPNACAFAMMLKTFALLSLGGICLSVFYIILCRNDNEMTATRYIK